MFCCIFSCHLFNKWKYQSCVCVQKQEKKLNMKYLGICVIYIFSNDALRIKCKLLSKLLGLVSVLKLTKCFFCVTVAKTYVWFMLDLKNTVVTLIELNWSNWRKTCTVSFCVEVSKVHRPRRFFFSCSPPSAWSEQADNKLSASNLYWTIWNASAHSSFLYRWTTVY